ncbi:MAG: hypothetical protein ACI855_004807, partial [Myxococcota bacterium]
VVSEGGVVSKLRAATDHGVESNHGVNANSGSLGDGGIVDDLRTAAHRGIRVDGSGVTHDGIAVVRGFDVDTADSNVACSGGVEVGPGHVIKLTSTDARLKFYGVLKAVVGAFHVLDVQDSGGKEWGQIAGAIDREYCDAAVKEAAKVGVPAADGVVIAKDPQQIVGSKSGIEAEDTGRVRGPYGAAAAVANEEETFAVVADQNRWPR